MNKSTILLLGSLAVALVPVSYYFLSGNGPSGLAATSLTGSPPSRLEIANEKMRSESAVFDAADAPQTVADAAPPSTRAPAVSGTAGQTAENPLTPRHGGSNSTGKTTPLAVTNVPHPSIPAGPIFEIPLGLQVPAVLIETDPSLQFSPLQEELVRGAREQFLADLDQSRTGTPAAPAVDGTAWKNAQANADTRFRKLFGDAAYLRQSLNAAKIAPTTAE